MRTNGSRLVSRARAMLLALAAVASLGCDALHQDQFQIFPDNLDRVWSSEELARLESAIRDVGEELGYIDVIEEATLDDFLLCYSEFRATSERMPPVWFGLRAHGQIAVLDVQLWNPGARGARRREYHRARAALKQTLDDATAHAGRVVEVGGRRRRIPFQVELEAETEARKEPR